MDDFLHELVVKRLVAQARVWGGSSDAALVVVPDDLSSSDQLISQLGIVNPTCIALSDLKHQQPSPTYDWIYVHLYSISIEQQELLFQMLAFLAKEGAALFFSGFSANTFQGLPAYCDESYVPIAFEDMHNTADLLSHSGFTDAAISQEEYKMTYRTVESLVSDYRIVLGQQSVDLPLLSSRLDGCVLAVEIALGHAIYSRQVMLKAQGLHEVSIEKVVRRKA